MEWLNKMLTIVNGIVAMLAVGVVHIMKVYWVTDLYKNPHDPPSQCCAYISVRNICTEICQK